MKPKIFALVLALFMLCTACAHKEQKRTVEGIWYSVSNEGMYRFSDGGITLSGMAAGQYEENDRYTVVSLAESGGNMMLFISERDGVEILVDENGVVQFCRGLENVEKFTLPDEYAERDSFTDYLDAHLSGTWTAEDQNAEVVKWEFFDDFTARKTDRSGTVTMIYILEWTVTEEDDVIMGSFYVSEDEDGEQAEGLDILPLEDTYENHRLKIGSQTYVKER